MDDSSSPSPRQVKIRPAGWVVLALAIAGLGWVAFRFAAPHLGPMVERLKQAERAPEAPSAPAEPTTPPPAAQEQVVPAALFPAAAPGLPPPGELPSVALPAFSSLRPPSGRPPVSGEREALQQLARGEVAYAVVSVPALAALPEVVEAGARVVWSLGAAPEDAALFPSCDPEVLRQQTLGVETGTAGHLVLLAALADRPLPPITGYDDEARLSRARAEGVITGGARHLPPGTTGCLPLPVAATTLVVVRGPNVEPDPSQVAAVAALARRVEPAESVASFLDPSRRSPGGFVDVYERSQQVWRSIGLVERTLPASRALASPEQPASVSPPDQSRWGRPSWPDGR